MALNLDIFSKIMSNKNWLNNNSLHSRRLLLYLDGKISF